MIFSSIKNTNNKDEILEKILVYIRIVEVIAEKNKASIPSASISETIISELKIWESSIQMKICLS